MEDFMENNLYNEFSEDFLFEGNYDINEEENEFNDIYEYEEDYIRMLMENDEGFLCLDEDEDDRITNNDEGYIGDENILDLE
jgi:hypothetical protein